MAAKRRRIYNNSPVILGFGLICVGVLGLSLLTGGRVGAFLATYYTSFLDPLFYLRLFTHSVTHLTLNHLASNMMLILVVGPLVEEKYGSAFLLVTILFTSALTGLINAFFFKQTALLGASGIVFMLILLASFTNMKEGTIPVTFLLVAVLYLGNEIVTGIVQQDTISQIAHIIGGLCGAGFGFAFHKKN